MIYSLRRSIGSYLDKSLAIVPPDADVELYKQQFHILCRQLGLAVNHEKDAEEIKLRRGETLLRTLLNKTSVPRSELDSLVDFLSSAGRRPRHALSKQGSYIHINGDMRQDLQW
jgi:hypothetical protein